MSYPAALYRSMRWWVAVGVAFTVVGLIVGAWVAGNTEVQATIAAPEQIRQLVEHDFEDYYSSAPAGSFAAKVATNNAWVAALALALGVFLLPVVWILWQNALNVGIAAGLMAANDRLGLFFGLILPHGLLELTCVFVAAGAGLRLGWSWIDPGRAHPVPGAARGGAGRRRAGHRARGDAVRLRRRRGLRHAVRAAHLGPDRHRRDPVGELPACTSSCSAAVRSGPARSVTCAAPARPTWRRQPADVLMARSHSFPPPEPVRTRHSRWSGVQSRPAALRAR